MMNDTLSAYDGRMSNERYYFLNIVFEYESDEIRTHQFHDSQSMEVTIYNWLQITGPNIANV